MENTALCPWSMVYMKCKVVTLLNSLNVICIIIALFNDLWETFHGKVSFHVHWFMGNALSASACNYLWEVHHIYHVR